MPRFPALLDHRHTMLLRAAVGEGNSAVDAYRMWRASETLDETDDTVYRILPLLLAAGERAGLPDLDGPRLRGAIKHIWLSNMLRIQDLMEAKSALDAAGIDSLLIKGGALFARNEQFAALRAAGDYDLQVRRSKARDAIRVLEQASFRCLGMRLDLFSDADFDRDIHAVAMTKSNAGAAIDLHWRPLPRLFDEALVEEQFAHAETARFFGQKVRIPALADHLFLAVVRPEPWDNKETLLRAIEITQVLRNCGGVLDWSRFEGLVARYGMGWISAPLLSLVRDEAGAPMPAGLVERVWHRALPGKTVELSLRRTPPRQQGKWSQFLLALFDSLRTQLPQDRSWRRLIAHPTMLIRFLAAANPQFPYLKRVTLKRLWVRRTTNDVVPGDAGLAFVQGFSVPEKDGRWTDAEFAVIEAAVVLPKQATSRMELSIVPFLPAGAKQFEFDIYAGVAAPKRYKLTANDPMPFLLQVDTRVVGNASPKVVIAFRLLNLVRPTEIGHSEDARLLGLFIRSVTSNVGLKAEDAAG